MRIGYCSPFNPIPSGISDFSEELALVLKARMEVVIFSEVPPENPAIARDFEVHDLSELDNAALRQTLDLIVYHIGNNWVAHGKIIEMLRKYPGVVELHDIGLHDLATYEADHTQNWPGYIELAGYCHGQRGRQIAEDFLAGKAREPWLEHPLDMCMNRRILDQASAIIVHSDMAKQMVLADHPGKPIAHIPHHSAISTEPPKDLRARCRRELGLPQKKLIFGSFGFASKDKRIPQIIEALRQFRKAYGSDFLYCIVGSAAEDLHLEETLRKLQLQEQVVVTGFVSLEDFNRYVGACDFCLNLRYPTRGESSGSLHRMLGMGKPVVVTNIGTFMEYPDEVAQKIGYGETEAEEICKAMLSLTKRKDAEAMNLQIRRYAEEHFSLATNAKRYADFFEQVLHHTWTPDYMDRLVDRLLELGLTHPDYTAHLSRLLQGAFH